MSTASHRNRFHSTDNITKGGDQYYLIVGIQPDGNIYLHLLQSTYRTRGEHQHCHSKNKTLTLSSFLFVVYTLSNTPVVAALEWLVVSWLAAPGSSCGGQNSSGTETNGDALWPGTRRIRIPLRVFSAERKELVYTGGHWAFNDRWQCWYLNRTYVQGQWTPQTWTL